MVRMVLPKDEWKAILRRRGKSGADRFDEVWNGTYVMSPLADNSHQLIATGLAAAFLNALADRPGSIVLAGVNLSDHETKWRKNYRCPDVAVFLPGNPAEDRGTHWFGGPDFAVEVVGKGDRNRKKIPFYAGVNFRELLIVDRAPWRLQLYRNAEGHFELVGTFTLAEPGPVDSAILPVSFRLAEGEPRPKVVVDHSQDGRSWSF